MIRKQNLKDSNKVKVTFVLPEDQGAKDVSVLGDFNQWQMPGERFIRRRNGTYSASVTLEQGRRYAFRYRSADGTWHNDSDADLTEPNQFGSQNSVVLT